METTAGTTNAIAAEARVNRDALLAKVREVGGESEQVQSLMRASQNENRIQEMATDLVRLLEQGKRYLDEAILYVNQNQPRCLNNTAGILQNINHDIDAAVTELRNRIQWRMFYSELLA